MLIRDFMARHHRHGNRAARRNHARLDYRICNGDAADQNQKAAPVPQWLLKPANIITVPKPKPAPVENTAPVDPAQAAKDRRNAAARQRRAAAKLALARSAAEGGKLAKAA